MKAHSAQDNTHAALYPVVVGPAWTHIPESVDRMQLYGAVSADIDPDRYIGCVRALLRDYELSDTPAPLVVNTMGWKQGNVRSDIINPTPMLLLQALLLCEKFLCIVFLCIDSVTPCPSNSGDGVKWILVSLLP